jgi:putative endonuclease
MSHPMYVYMMTNRSRTLYTGTTWDVPHRVGEHRTASRDTFCGRYNIRKLVHVEEFPRPADAIRREKQIKGWRRAKKIALIESRNPEWKDLMPE